MLNKPLLTEDVDTLWAIKSLCKKRKYRCKGCSYSAKKLTVLQTTQTCIFANCPCDWNIYSERKL